MVISEVGLVRAPDLRAFAWGELNQYQNVDHTANLIVDLHGLQTKHKANARKQAAELRYCLSQAREYFAAADAVSLATRPVLQYYGAMSLALAEILFKQSADSRLAKLRAEHNCHGLSFVVEPQPKIGDSLISLMDCLRAKPQTDASGLPRGTFEVWRRCAREHPVAGNRVESEGAQGASKTTLAVLYVAEDEPPRMQPAGGISLGRCIRNLPYLSRALTTWGCELDMVRATVTSHVAQNKTSKTTLIVHPASRALLDRFIELPKLRSGDVDNIEVSDMSSGYIINHNEKLSQFTLPWATCLSEKEVFFSCSTDCLGEFGFSFVALHILGNFARYYPEIWMEHIARNSPLASIADVFCSYASARLPLLTLSELARRYVVVEH